MENSLLESEEQLRAIVQTAADAIISIDSSDEIIFWK